MRAGVWIERDTMQRSDWDVEYTHIGGRSGHDYTQILAEEIRPNAVRAVGQVMVAKTPRRSEPRDDVRLWATVARRLAQRGSLPAIPSSVGLPSTDDLTPEQLLEAVTGPVGDPIELDAQLNLDSPVEYDFWKLLGKHAPRLQRWCIPQASLDRLAGSDHERWVDFLFDLPWQSVPKVIELDHEDKDTTQSHVMAARDEDLREVGIVVERVTNRDAVEATADVHLRLAAAEQAAPENPTEDALLAVHGPPLLWRFLYALAEAAESGFLPSGGEPWIVDVTDQVGAFDTIATHALDIAAALADVWNLDVVPSRLILNGTTYERLNTGRYETATTPDRTQPHLHVVFEPFRSPVEELATPSTPTIVFRNLLLPIDLPWSSHTITERPTTSESKRQGAALLLLLEDIFDHTEFQGSQGEAIARLLAGEDELVLMPTGQGKTLIYQMAGLLMPGTTLVVAPLRALIDDQERRLEELGIDRVVAIHSGRKALPGDRERLNRAIATNDALFVLVAPERLQIESFRDTLKSAAQNALINIAVIDEVHSLSEWGHQFRLSYLKLGQNIQRFASTGGADADDQGTDLSTNPPLTALTATAGPRVLDDIVRDLGLDHTKPGALFRPKSFKRPELNYVIKHTESRKRPNTVVEALSEIAEGLGVDVSDLGRAQGDDTLSGIIFVPHANGKVGIYRYRQLVAKTLGIPTTEVAVYSGRQPDGITDAMIRREGAADYDEYRVMQATAYRLNHKPVMVATNAFGMGIDKRNIRYTIHVTMPGSLEAFAQETGRAGRDGMNAHNVLVVSLPDADEADRMLKQERKDRKRAYVEKSEAVRNNDNKSDIDLQLYFHHSSFPDSEAEMRTAMELYDELTTFRVPSGTEITVQRERKDSDGPARERALYRLGLLGIVEDYTIKFRAGEFTVTLTNHDQESIDESLQAFVLRTTRVSADADSATESRQPDLRAHVEARLKTLLEYAARVEIGRIRALSAMYDLARSNLDSGAIHDRLDAYLGSGPVAELLERLVVTEEMDLDESTAELVENLTKTAPISSEEWAGAATRFIESYPEHPLVLTVLALGEAWRGGDSFQRFVELIPQVIEQFQLAGLHPDDLLRLLTWILGLLRRIDGFGDRSGWTVAVWKAIHNAGLAAIQLEDEVLAGAPIDGGPCPSLMEQRAVLTNRLIRHAHTIKELERKVNPDDNHDT